MSAKSTDRFRFIQFAIFIVVAIAFTLGGGYLAATSSKINNERKEDRTEVIINELMDLYSFNYTETENPTKRERLRASLRRILKAYKCDPQAIPDLKSQCKIPHGDIIERLYVLYKKDTP